MSGAFEPAASFVAIEVAPTGGLRRAGWVHCRRGFSPDGVWSLRACRLRSSRLKSLLQGACGAPAGCTVGGALAPTVSGAFEPAASLVATEVAPTGACGEPAGCTVGGALAPTVSGTFKPAASLVATEVAPTGACGEPAGCTVGGLQPRQCPEPSSLRLLSSRLKSLPQGACGGPAGCTIGGASAPTVSGAVGSTASFVAAEAAPAGMGGEQAGALWEGLQSRLQDGASARCVAPA